MFHRKNVFRNVIYNLGPTITIIILMILIFALSYVFYLKYIYKALAISERKLFGRYIYDYALNMYSGNDLVVSYTINSFQFNDTMFDSEDSSKTWSNDVSVFQSVIGQMQSLAVASSIRKSNYFENKKIWQIIHHFIKTVQAKLPTSPVSFVYPWGDNWYQFSITYPLFLVIAAYLYEQVFHKRSDTLFNYLTLYINNYFKEPKSISGIHSMGWLRDGPNALMMAVPYIGGHLLMKNLNKRNNIMKYVKDFARFEYRTSGEGLYEDGGFIFHTNLRAYGYLYGSFNDIILIAKYYKFNSPQRIQKVFEIFEHPDLHVHFGPWFSRSKRLTTTPQKSKYGKIGFFCVDSINAVVAKTNTWMLAFNGQSPKICFYESDQTDNALCQVWTGARLFMDKDTDKVWYEKLIPHYPGVISFDSKLVIMPSDRATTKTFLPNQPSSTIMCSFNDAIGMRNQYSLSTDGFRLSVIELILITKQGHHSYYSIEPDQQLHASNPLTVSMNLGKFTDGSTSAGGLGEMYDFTKNKTFVYSNNGEVVLDNVRHPETKVEMKCLKIHPRLNDEGKAKFGYSTVFQNINQIAEIPKDENCIETTEYKLEYEPKNGYMFLYEMDGDNTRVAVSKAYPSTYVRDIAIPKSIVNEKFGTNFKVSNAAIINNEYRKYTKDRYQMILEDVLLD